MVIDFNDVHPMKALAEILLTVAGMITDVKLEQNPNVYVPIFVTPLGIVIVLSDVHP